VLDFQTPNEVFQQLIASASTIGEGVALQH